MITQTETIAGHISPYSPASPPTPNLTEKDDPNLNYTFRGLVFKLNPGFKVNLVVNKLNKLGTVQSMHQQT